VALDDTRPTISAVNYLSTVEGTKEQSINVTATDTGFTDGVQSCIVEVQENGIVRPQNYSMTDAGTDSFTLTLSPPGAGTMVFKVFCTDKHGWSRETGTYTYTVWYAGKSWSDVQPRVVTQPARQSFGEWFSGLIGKIVGWFRGLFGR